jgi:glycolate oxidase
VDEIVGGSVDEIVGDLCQAVGAANVLTSRAIDPDYTHDEALTATARSPRAVVRPASTEEVSEVVRIAARHGVGVTARGSGTGLSGGAIAPTGGVLVSFERMDQILEIDADNHAAVVQAGVTLQQLDAATAAYGLVYPVFPGEKSASIGGNVATNAGGMRAVKYGVTRHHVRGLEAVLGTGEVIRTGGKFVKSSTGYDLTQLIIGSEGTLALVTEATLKLHPRLAHAATVLAPFGSLHEVTAAVPRVVQQGTTPLILEYVDSLTMNAITSHVGLDLGIPQAVRASASAYLVVVLESVTEDRLEEDVGGVGQLLSELGAIEVYVLPPQAAGQLIEARERAFFVAKAAGADDIVDVVVPRAAIPAFLDAVAKVAEQHGALVTGCGHAGDGNVHLSVFQPDPSRRREALRAIFGVGLDLGGAISGEHGIGTEKKQYFLELEDPHRLELMRRVKAAFDPQGILGPGNLLDEEDKLSGR